MQFAEPGPCGQLPGQHPLPRPVGGGARVDGGGGDGGGGVLRLGQGGASVRHGCGGHRAGGRTGGPSGWRRGLGAVRHILYVVCNMEQKIEEMGFMLPSDYEVVIYSKRIIFWYYFYVYNNVCLITRPCNPHFTNFTGVRQNTEDL